MLYGQYDDSSNCLSLLTWRLDALDTQRRRLLMHWQNLLLVMTRFDNYLIWNYQTHSPYQSINIIQSPRLKKIFLLLKKDLSERDIPGRTTIHNHINQMFEEHMARLKAEAKVWPLLCSISQNTEWLNRSRSEKSPSPLIHGLTQIKYRFWVLQLIGFKTPMMNSNFGLILSASVKFLDAIRAPILHTASYGLLTALGLLRRYLSLFAISHDLKNVTDGLDYMWQCLQ